MGGHRIVIAEIRAKYKKNNKIGKQYKDQVTDDIHQLREDYENLKFKWGETEKKLREIEHKNGMTIQKKITKIIKERYKKKELNEPSFLQIEEAQKIGTLEKEREKIEEKYEYDRKKHEEQKKIAQQIAIIRSWKMITEENKPLRIREKLENKKIVKEEKKIKNKGLIHLSRNTPIERHIDKEYEKKYI